MATFNCTGLDELSAAFDDTENIPREIIGKALTEGAKILKAEQEKVGKSKGVYDPTSSVHVIENIKINKPKFNDDGASVSITFAGTRTRGNQKVRNAEIAFINEFGKEGVPAKNFVKTANEQAKDKAIDAALSVIHDYIKETFEK